MIKGSIPAKDLKQNINRLKMTEEINAAFGLTGRDIPLLFIDDENGQLSEVVFELPESINSEGKDVLIEENALIAVIKNHEVSEDKTDESISMNRVSIDERIDELEKRIAALERK